MKRSAIRVSSVDTRFPDQASPDWGSWGLSPENPHLRSSTRMGQSGGISTSMRRIEGSVCSAPMEGIGNILMRCGRSSGPAPRPMTNLSNSTDCDGRNSCNRCVAASRRPTRSCIASASERARNSPFDPRNSKCRCEGGESYPVWRNDPFGGWAKSWRIRRPAPSVVNLDLFRRYRSTRLSRVPGRGTGVLPAARGVLTVPG